MVTSRANQESMSLGKSISALLIENRRVAIHTYDISMKTRPKGHIANKLNKVAEEQCTTTIKKIVLTNAALLRFVIIVPIIAGFQCHTIQIWTK